MTTESNQRMTCGIEGLDELLGGGLIPGTLTVVVGSTGIGKTQLGASFSRSGLQQEGRTGLFYDMTSRGDSQSHHEYCKRMFDWELEDADPEKNPILNHIFEESISPGDYLHVFKHSGRRVLRSDVGDEDWRVWKQEMVSKLNTTIAYFYSNFVRGTRRVIIDGIEPAAKASESIQLDLFEYIYHQILHKEYDWVARDLFRQSYREFAEQIEAGAYNHQEVGSMLLYTAHEPLLEQLITRPLDEGDLLTNANTVIFLGKVKDGLEMKRAIYIAKHRGSACSDAITPYTITNKGIEFLK